MRAGSFEGKSRIWHNSLLQKVCVCLLILQPHRSRGVRPR